MLISDILRTGRENAMPLQEIKEEMQRNADYIRRHIVEEREAGIAICEDEHGYYLPADDNEIKECAARVGAEIVERAKVWEQLQKVARDPVRINGDDITYLRQKIEGRLKKYNKQATFEELKEYSDPMAMLEIEMLERKLQRELLDLQDKIAILQSIIYKV